MFYDSYLYCQSWVCLATLKYLLWMTEQLEARAPESVAQQTLLHSCCLTSVSLPYKIKKGTFLLSSVLVGQLSTPCCLSRAQQPRLAYPAWDLALFYHPVFVDWQVTSLLWLSCWAAVGRVIQRFLVGVFGQAYLSQDCYLDILNKRWSSSSSILKMKLFIFGSFLTVK